MNILIKTSLLALPVLFFSACSHADSQRVETREFSLKFPNPPSVSFDGKRVNRDAYADIATNVKEIAAAKNGNVDFKNGTFTVKSNAGTLDEISTYIDNMNKIMSKVVSIHVTFYAMPYVSGINPGEKPANAKISTSTSPKSLTDFDVFNSLSEFKNKINGVTLSTLSVEGISTTNKNPAVFTSISLGDTNRAGYFIVTPTMENSSNTIAMWVNTEMIRQPSAQKKMATFIVPMKRDQIIVIRHLGFVNNSEVIGVVSTH